MLTFDAALITLLPLQDLLPALDATLYALNTDFLDRPLLAVDTVTLLAALDCLLFEAVVSSDVVDDRRRL